MTTHATPERIVAHPASATTVELGESPRACADGTFVWVDCFRGDIYRGDPEHLGPDVRSGEPFLRMDAHVGSVVPRQRGGWAVATLDQIVLLDPSGRREDEIVCPVNLDNARFNDGACDPAGRLVVGTICPDFSRTDGELLIVEPSGAVRVVRDGITISNGIDWSPDGRTMYYVDSPTHNVEAIAYDADAGRIGESRVFATIEDGVPDGLTVDTSGNVWVAVYGGHRVQMHDPQGTHRITVATTAEQTTACAFVGSRCDVLLMTSARRHYDDDARRSMPDAGKLFTAALGGRFRGIPARGFAG